MLKLALFCETGMFFSGKRLTGNGMLTYNNIRSFIVVREVDS